MRQCPLLFNHYSYGLWWMVSCDFYLSSLLFLVMRKLFIFIVIIMVVAHGILHAITFWYLHWSLWCSGAIIDLFIYWITQYLVIEYWMHKTTKSSIAIKRKLSSIWSEKCPHGCCTDDKTFKIPKGIQISNDSNGIWWCENNNLAIFRLIVSTFFGTLEPWLNSQCPATI